MNAREAAYKSLLRIEKDKKYAALELDSVISSGKLDEADRSLYTSVLYGVTEKKITLDYIISLFSAKPLSRLDDSTLILLRMGCYQICFLDRIPDSAAVNETVKLSARYSARSKGFINAILRKIAAQKNAIVYPSKEDDHLKYLSVKYSLPEWICKLFCDDYPEEGEKLFEFVNSDPCITLRVNTLKTSVNDLIEKTEFAEKCKYSPFGVRLKNHMSISKLPLNEGLCFVQDEASQIECTVLDPKEGDTLIDVCACPGGKSFSAAIEMKNNGKIYSFDLHESKLSLITKEAEKLGISIISAERHDSAAAVGELIGKADKVICDVPCSGLGVLHKKSDLRHKDEDSLNDLPELQYKILCESAKYLKSGGTLVYSTCTILKRENEEVVNRFLADNDGYSLSPFSIGDTVYPGMVTMLPHVFGTDGFFIAKITVNQRHFI